MGSDLSLPALRALLLNRQPGDFAKATDAIGEILENTPEIGQGVELPAATGVVRYDSHAHSDDALTALPWSTQQRVLLSLQQHPERRVVITQTAPWATDDAPARRNLIAAQHGLRLVTPSGE
jgi:predicted dinucleotide-binding enzyme